MVAPATGPGGVCLKRILAIAVGIAAAVASFAQVDPDRVVFSVNGEEVKGGEYYRRMEYLPNVTKRFGRTNVEFPPGFLTIEQLITEHLILQLAKEKGCLPTDAEIQAELKSRSDDDPKFLDNWIAGGQTREELLQQLKIEVAQFKILTFGITITDQEVQKFYEDNPPMFTIPKRYKLRIIVVSNETAKNAVDSDLASGKSFADVAKARSEDITKVSGGDFGVRAYTLLPETVQTALNGVKIGATSGWCQTGIENTIAKFLIEDILKEELQPLTPKRLNDTRRQLMLQRGTVKNNLERDMIEMRKKAKIDIKQKEFADAYKRFLDEYLNQATKSGS